MNEISNGFLTHGTTNLSDQLRVILLGLACIAIASGLIALFIRTSSSLQKIIAQGGLRSLIEDLFIGVFIFALTAVLIAVLAG